jgi:hypothetical protein
MHRRTLGTLALAAILATITPGALRADDDDQKKLAVTVSFGVGLNTAQQGNVLNHHVLPQTIHVKAGGVVNFAVAGFHQIFVYQPGRGPEDIVVPAAGTFINDTTGLYYEGILPAGGPPPGIPATLNRSNAENRMESVSFFEPGTYLVICNVRRHFLDGMYAIVEVTAD